MLNKKVLLISLSDTAFYEKSKVKAVVPNTPSLTIATLAGMIKNKRNGL